jgi:recombination protein RecA
LGQGRDAVRNLLLDNPELQDELESKIKATIHKENNPEIVEEAELA